MVSPRDSRISALPPLHTIGFQLDVLSAADVNGYLRVTDSCCQSFNTLHGGVSALISEALARIGIQVASGSRQVTGVHLSINHHRSAAAGDLVFASGTPVEADEKEKILRPHVELRADSGRNIFSMRRPFRYGRFVCGK